MTATPRLAPVGPPSAPDADPALRPFLEALDEESARARLGELVEAWASPLVSEVVRSDLRGTPDADLEDVHAGVLLSLAAHLRGLRSGDGEPIRTFESYVAVMAHNACHAFLRARVPEMARLRSRVRYVLTRDPSLGLWEGPAREWLCGSAPWRGSPEEPSSVPRLAEAGREVASGDRFPDLVRAVVAQLPGPARFDDLVAAIAAIQGVGARQVPVRRAQEDDGAGGDDPLRNVSDPSPSPEEALARRSYLERLWAEIRALPTRQRAALLLNLREADGSGMIGLFPLTGTAGLPELAEALDMSEERLRGLWDELPRDDEWIAERLGITRRQVINLRKCARERLARRLRRAGW